MSQEIIKKFGPVLNSIDTNMIMQSSFLESMYNIAAESERRTTSLLTKILNVLDGQKNAMMTNVSRDTIAKEYSFVKSNLKNIFQTQNKESNNRVNQLFTNYSSELLNAMTVNNENLSEMVSKAISTIDNNDLLSIKSSTDNTVSDSSDISSSLSNISTDLTNVTSSLSNVTSDVLTNVTSDVTSDISSSLSNVTSDVLTNVTTSLSNVTTSLSNVTSDVLTNVTTSLSNVTSDVLTNVTTSLSNVTTSLSNVTSDVLTNVTTSLSNVTSDVSSSLSNVTSDVLSNVTSDISSDVSSSLTNVTSGVLTNVTSSLSNVTSDILSNVTSDVLSNVTSDISSSLPNISTDLTNVTSDISSSLSNVTSDILSNVTSDVLSNVSEMSNDTSKNILSLTESLSELGFIQSEQNNNSFNSQEISRLLTERASISDGESDEIIESYSYQQLIYEENVRQTSLLERLVGIGEQNLENYEDAERRRLLSDPPSNQDDDSQNQDEEDDTESKREKPKLGNIGKWIARIGALVLASPFILGFIEGFFGKKIGELIDAMKQKALEFLSDPKVLLGIAALVAALGLLLRPISTLIIGFKLLRGMLKLGGKAITGLGKMLGKLNLGKMFKNAFKGFGNFFKGSLGKITDTFKGSVGKISTLGASVANSVKSAGKSIANRLNNVKKAGGKGLLGGLFGALAGTSAATAQTPTSDRTSAPGSTADDLDKKQPTPSPNKDNPSNVQNNADKTQTPGTGSPDGKGTNTTGTTGQVSTDGTRPVVSDASRVPPIDEKKAAKAFLKSSAKYGVKLIPVVGEIAGILFAAGRLIEGDFVGAGMEAGGVLAPSLIGGATIDIATLARDMYKAYYGTNPETDDPELVKQRMVVLKEYIERKMSSAGAGEISQEDQYMSSDAAMITPGKAVGPGGVTVNTAPAGGYESSTAMALSQTEINRIRKIQGLPPLPESETPTSSGESNATEGDETPTNQSTFVEPNTTEIVGDNTTNVNTTDQSSTSEISASQQRTASQAAAKLKQAFGVDRSTIINSSTEQLKQMAAEYGGKSWFDTWTKNNVMEYFNTVIEGSPKNAEIVPPTSKDTNLGKKVDQMSNESSAMQSRGAPVIVRGGDNMMKGGDIIKGGDTTIINNTVIESQNFRNHIPT